MIGTTISHYKILEKLGEGGMGVVYKARDVKLPRTVALKFLPSYLNATTEELSRFRQEAEAISSLNNPYIATIYDVDEVDGKRFLVLEYVPGGTLKSKFLHGKESGYPISVPEILRYGIQVAEGLGHAHRHQIVHRDVKTENILLTEEDNIKITDFGLAKLGGKPQITKTGSTLGTAAYMSPEQIRGEDVDSRSDLFSFGVVLFEILTGQLPFKGDHDAALAYTIVNEQHPPVKSLRADVPASLDNVIDRCLEKEREKRFQSAEEIVQDLRSIQQEISGNVGKAGKQSKVPWIVASGILILIGVIYGISRLFITPSGKTEVPSLAILYLKNLGPVSDEPYTYGITQDLIVDIAKAGLIRVSTMKDILSVQKNDLSTEKIADQLHVRYVMDGSLKRENNLFHLSAQIVEASTGKTLWADHIQLNVVEAAELQGKLVQAIIHVLQLTTPNALMRNLTKPRSTDPEAYEFYLRAKYLINKKKSEDDVVVARELLKKSISLDSIFISPRISLGSTYEIAGEYQRAREIYESALPIALSTGNKVAQAECLIRLGVLRYLVSDFSSAIQYYNQSLVIIKTSGDSAGESNAYNDLGITYTDQGDYQRALDSYNYALHIARIIEDRRQESVILNNIGTVYLSEGNYAKASEIFARCLEIKQHLNDHRGEAIALENIGTVYENQGDYSDALDYYGRALTISEPLKLVPIKASILKLIGQAISDQGDTHNALKYLSESLNLYREIGEKLSEGEILRCIGKIYIKNRDYRRSIDSLAISLQIFQETDSKENLLSTLSLLALAEIQSGSRINAESHVKTAEALVTVIPKGSEYIESLWNLSQVNSLLGNREAASEHLREAYKEMMLRADHTATNESRNKYLNNVKLNSDISLAWEKSAMR